MIDERAVRAAIADYQVVEAIAHSIAKEMAAMYGFPGSWIDDLTITDAVRFDVEEDDGYSRYVEETLEFPLSYLWTPNYHAALRNGFEAWKEKKAQALAAKKQEEKAEQRRKDQAELLRLQAKLKTSEE